MANVAGALMKAWEAAVHRSREVPGTRPEVWQEHAKHESPFVRVVLVNIDDGMPYEMSGIIRTRYISLYTWAARRYGGKTAVEKRKSWKRAKKMIDRIVGARFNQVKHQYEVPAESPLPILKRRGPKPGDAKKRSLEASGQAGTGQETG